MMQSGNRHSKSEHCFTPKIPFGGDLTPLQHNDSSSKELANLTRHRQMSFAPDIDIAQGLINEIRKLQQAIQEKDRLIMDLEISKADKEKDQEQAHKHLRQKTRLEEKLKEDNWNLEVANQDLQTNILELNQTITKLNFDLNKSLQQLRTSLDHADTIKAQQDKTTAAMDAMKVKHDHEQQLLRRNNGTLHRDIKQLKKRLDDANTDLKISKAKLAIKSTSINSNNGIVNQHYLGNDHIAPASNDTINGSDTDSITLKSSSIGSNSPNISTNLQHALEIETLKQSLGHAYRMISSLRTSLQKEKGEKIELRRLLLDTQETMEQLQKDSTNESYINNNNNGASRKSVKKSSGANRIKVPRKHGISAEKGALAMVEQEKIEIEEILDDEQLESLTVKTPLNSKLTDDNTGIVLLDNYGTLSGDDNISMDDTSSLNSDEDSGSDLRLDLSPIGHGQSLDLELNLCGLGGSFKSLSSELQELSPKRQYHDKGVNTYDDFGYRPSFEQHQSIGLHSGTKAFHQKPNDCNEKWIKNHSDEYNHIDKMSPAVTVNHDPVYQPTSAPKTSLQLDSLCLRTISLDYIGTSNDKQQENMETSLPSTNSRSCQEEKQAEPQANPLNVTPQHVFAPSLTTTIITDGESTFLCKPPTTKSHQDIPTTIKSSASTTDQINSETISAIPTTNDKMTTTSPIIDGISRMCSSNYLITDAVDPSTSHSPLTVQKNDPSSASTILPTTESHDTWKLELPGTNRSSFSAVKQDDNFGHQAMTIKHNDPTPPVVLDDGILNESRSLINHDMVIRLDEPTESETCDECVDMDTVDQQAALDLDNHTVKQSELTYITQHIMKTEESMGDGISHKTTGYIENNTTMKTLDSIDGIDYKEPKKDDNFYGHSCTPRSDMISRSEMDALVKAGIADALAKERFEKNDQEQGLGTNTITMDEAEALAKTRTEEALVEERNKTSTMLTKDEAEIMARNYAEEALKSYNKRKDHDISTKTSSTKSLFLAKASTISRQNSASISRGTSKPTPQCSTTPSPISSISISSTTTAAPPSPRFGILSGLMKLQPSISTPVKTGRLRPSPSTSSLRKMVASVSTLPQHQRQTPTLGPHKRNSRPNQNAYHSDLDRHLKPPTSTPSFGTLRITGTAMYSRTTSPPSLRSQKQQPQHQLAKKQFMQSPFSNTLEQDNISVDLASTCNSPSSAELVLAITQTMIGEWMWKHTRRHVGSGISENKHKRFFWVHPYTRTLYWGNSEPGIDADEAKAKSALIERISSIPSHDTMGASPLSLLIKTGKRDLKLTAPTLERHELWRMSLSYLLVPPDHVSTMGDLIQVDPYHDADNITVSSTRGSVQTLPIANANTPGDMDDQHVTPLKDTRSLYSNVGDEDDDEDDDDDDDDDEVLGASTSAATGGE